MLSKSFDERAKNRTWLMDSFVSFKANVEKPGDEARFTLTYPVEIPGGFQLWHVNPKTNKLTSVPFRRRGKHSVVYSIRDGSELDVDGVANGVIDDPVGIGGPYLTEESAILVSDDIEAGDKFGNGVSTSGNYAIVGAPEENGKGAAYIFEKQGSNWVQVKKLTDDSGSTGDDFGYMVAISGNVAAVAIPGLDHSGSDNRGEVQIFENSGNNNWTLANSIRGTNLSDQDNFGFALDMSDTNIIVGVNNEGKDHPGAAYIYEKVSNDWTEVGVVTGSAVLDGDAFGGSVAISGDYAVVSAEFHWLTTESNHVGRAYIYENKGDNDWVQVVQLSDPNQTSNVHFGAEVEIFEDYVVVSSTGQGAGGSTGAVTVFENQGDNDWDDVATLTASDGESLDYFGDGLDIYGRFIVVSSPGEYEPLAADPHKRPGKAYVFENLGSNNWTEVHKLVGSNSGDVDRFGFPVSCSDEHIIVGARSNDVDGTDAGQAYIYSICTPPTFWSDDLDVTADWTLYGSPSFVADQHSTYDVAIDADGINDYVTAAAVSVSGDDDVTVSCWVKTTMLANALIIGQRGGTGVDGLWELRLTSSGQYLAVANGSTSTSAAVYSKTSASYSDGEWHHVMFTIKNQSGSAADINIYVDGTEAAYANENTVELTGFNGFVNSSVLSVAAFGDGGSYFFNGKVSRPRIWKDHAVTGDCITKEYDREFDLLLCPPPIFLSDDLDDSGVWASYGSVAFEPDQHSTYDVAIDADGSNDYVTAAAVSVAGDDHVTVSCWVKTMMLDNALIIGQRGGTGVDGLWELRLTSTGQYLVVANGSTSTSASVYSKTSASYSDGEWHHVMFTIENESGTGADINIYVDGSEAAYADEDTVYLTGFNGFVNSSPVSVGAFGDGGSYFFSGNVSRPRIWKNKALASHCVDEEFSSEFELILCPPPVLLSNDLDDSSVWTSYGTPTFVADQHSTYDVAIDADGVNDYVTAAAVSESGDTKVTVSLWVKIGTTGNDIIAAQRNNVVVDGLWELRLTSTGQFMAVANGSTSTSAAVYSKTSSTYDDGEWHHVIFTIENKSGNAADINIYVDGAEAPYADDNTVWLTGFNGFVNDSVVSAGGYGAGGSNFDGIVSRVRVWKNAALLEDCALEEYAVELETFLVPVPTVSSDDLDDSSMWTSYGSPSFVADQHSTYDVAIDADGSDDYVTAAAVSKSGDTKVSVALWVKISSAGTGEDCVIAQRGNSGVDGLWELRINASGQLTAVANGSTSTSAAVYSKTSSAYDDDTWHHVLFTIENQSGTGADINIYIDGSEVSYADEDTVYLTGFNGFVNDSVLSVGAYGTGGYNFNGIVSRVRVWKNVALSSTQASDEYDAEAP